MSPERIFLSVGLVAGMAFLVVTPPFEGADEPAHFYRAYQISEGGIRAERRGDLVGGLLPRSLRERRHVSAPDMETGAVTASAPLRAGDREFIDFRTTGPYAAVPYLPQALAIGLGRQLDLPPVVLLYLGRLAGLAASLVVVFLAIRTAPMAKHVLLLIAVAPIALRQMALLSADSVTNAVAFLFIAIVLRLSLVTGAALRGRWIAALVLSALAVTLAKHAYVPLLLLILLCPVEQFGSRRRYLLIVLCTLGLSAAALAAWFRAIGHLYVPQPIAPTADPARQVAFILAEPIHYAVILLRDLRRNGADYLWHCLGYAGHVPARFGWVHLAGLGLVAVVDCGRPKALGWRAKVLLLTVLGATYALINTFNYLGWNPVGAERISFIQGRYFLPIAPLACLLLSNRRFASIVPARRLTVWSGWFAVGSALVALYGLARRWYGL